MAVLGEPFLSDGGSDLSGGSNYAARGTFVLILVSKLALLPEGNIRLKGVLATMFYDVFESKVLDEHGKRKLQKALESFEEWRPKVKRRRELEEFDRIIQLFKEAIQTGYVSDELEQLIDLAAKLNEALEAGVLQRIP